MKLQLFFAPNFGSESMAWGKTVIIKADFLAYCKLFSFGSAITCKEYVSWAESFESMLCQINFICFFWQKTILITSQTYLRSYMLKFFSSPKSHSLQCGHMKVEQKEKVHEVQIHFPWTCLIKIVHIKTEVENIFMEISS